MFLYNWAIRNKPIGEIWTKMLNVSLEKAEYEDTACKLEADLLIMKAWLSQFVITVLSHFLGYCQASSYEEFQNIVSPCFSLTFFFVNCCFPLLVVIVSMKSEICTKMHVNLQLQINQSHRIVFGQNSITISYIAYIDMNDILNC